MEAGTAVAVAATVGSGFVSDERRLDRLPAEDEARRGDTGLGEVAFFGLCGLASENSKRPRDAEARRGVVPSVPAVVSDAGFGPPPSAVIERRRGVAVAVDARGDFDTEERRFSEADARGEAAAAGVDSASVSVVDFDSSPLNTSFRTPLVSGTSDDAAAAIAVLESASPDSSLASFASVDAERAEGG